LDTCLVGVLVIIVVFGGGGGDILAIVIVRPTHVAGQVVGWVYGTVSLDYETGYLPEATWSDNTPKPQKMETRVTHKKKTPTTDTRQHDSGTETPRANDKSEKYSRHHEHIK
jgi:hypothetical protein